MDASNTRRASVPHSAAGSSPGGIHRSALLLASDLAVLFGLWERVSGPSGLLAIPIALWEFSLGVYLIVKGFKPSPITAGMTAASTPPADQNAAV